jgi:hypothetical protein
MSWNQKQLFHHESHRNSTIYNVDRHFERPCIVTDLSYNGAKISGVRVRTIPDEFRLLSSDGARRSCRVIWRTSDTLGVEFIDCEHHAQSGTQQNVSPLQSES